MSEPPKFPDAPYLRVKYKPKHPYKQNPFDVFRNFSGVNLFSDSKAPIMAG